ncbi:ABC transporter permease subunit, partial [bacterium]
RWLGGVVVGQFGTSSALQRGRPAEDLIWPAAKSSFALLFTGLTISVAIALALALSKSHMPDSSGTRAIGAVVGLISSIPVFLFVYIFVAGGNRFISWGAQGGYWSIPEWFPLPVEAAFIPWFFAAFILALGDGGLIDLYQRFSGELKHSATGDHITGVMIMGLSMREVIARGFIPGAVSHISRRISFYFGSLVVLEAALGWPGLGYLAWRAAAERDMPVLLGAALVMAGLLKLASMSCDFIGFLADPRQRNRG